MIKQDVFDIRGAVKTEIEKQVKEHLYEMGYKDGKANAMEECNEKISKLYQELADAYRKIERIKCPFYTNNGHTHICSRTCDGCTKFETFESGK